MLIFVQGTENFSLDDFVVTDTVPGPTSSLLLGMGGLGLVAKLRNRWKKMQGHL